MIYYIPSPLLHSPTTPYSLTFTTKYLFFLNLIAQCPLPAFIIRFTSNIVLCFAYREGWRRYRPYMSVGLIRAYRRQLPVTLQLQHLQSPAPCAAALAGSRDILLTNYYTTAPDPSAVDRWSDSLIVI